MEQWKGALTGSMMARLAPLCLQSSAARSTAALAPLITTWPGALMLAGSQTWPGHAAVFLAGGADLIDAEVQDGGHGSLAHRHRLLHELAAQAHRAHRVGKAKGAGGDVGGVLAQRVAGDKAGHNAGLVEHAGGGHRDGENRRLGDFGQPELFLRPSKQSRLSEYPSASSASSKVRRAAA
jgi:hypothetical protein